MEPGGAAVLRPRAFVLGLLLVPIHCFWAIRTEIFTGGSELVEASLLPLAVFTFLMLVAANALARRLAPRAALSGAELLTVYVMQIVSLGVAGLGQVQFLNQALAGVYRPHPDRSQWQAYLPLVPRGWTPDPAAVPAFLEGNSTLFTRAHLRAWAAPVGLWTGFLVAMGFGFLCLNTLLRRSWVEHERLPFPLTRIPLELTGTGSAAPAWSRPDFWGAFLLACVLRSVSALHRVEPTFPEPPGLGPKGQLVDIAPLFAEHPWTAVEYFRLSFHPMVVGIAYFLPLDVSFSQWFFYLVVKAEQVAAAALGWRGGANPATAEAPFTGEQGAGAFLAIAVFALWGARRHLGDVFGKALGDRPDVRDDDEPLPYRVAVAGFGLVFAALVAFVAWGGVPWPAGALFFALYFLMILTVTRMRAEAGPLLHYGPDLNPHRMLVLIPGARAWDPQALTGLTYLQWFDSDYRTVAMPGQMEALQIADAARLSPRRWTAALVGAGALATLASLASVLALYYRFGALTPMGDNGWRAYNGFLPFQILDNWVRDPRPPEHGRLAWVGAGFAGTAGLIGARSRFAWWPLHPVGFALAQAGYSLHWTWSATLLGWGAKALILRYGGMALYRRGFPFFVGLVLGDICVACLWSLLGIALDTQMYMFFPG